MSELKCPHRFTLPKKDQGCIKHECAWYQNVVGNNPKTGQPENGWACAIAWLPMILIENIAASDRGTASTDKVATIIFGGMPPQARERIINENPTLAPRPQAAPQIAQGKQDA